MNDFWVALGTVGLGIWGTVSSFANSNFFTSLSTILTVLGAVLIYLNQKQAEKQRIAAALVNEIRIAEDAISVLKNRPAGAEIPETTILPQNSWRMYSHLFTKDLDQDQINTLNKFYFEAERANYIVAHGNAVDIFLSNIKARTDAAHEKVLEIITKTPKGQLKKKMQDFSDNFYSQESFFAYSPNGFPNQLDSHLKNITSVLDSPAGIKLKELAGLQE